MPIEDIVNVTITTESTRVARAGFGIPLIAAYHTNSVERVKTYSASTALVSMVDEGFATTSPAYLAMASVLSQNPRPRQVMIGRRDNTWTQIVRLTPSPVANTTVYQCLVDGVLATYTSDGTALLAEICTGLAAAIDALAGVTASGVSGTHIDVTSDAAATLHTIEYVPGGLENFSIVDVTVEANIADDLNLIRAASDGWYGLVIDSCASSEIADAAAWAETQRVLFVPNSSDTDILSSSTTDLFSDLEAAGYARTIPLYSQHQDSFSGAAWLGVMLPYQPGEATWAYKSLGGVTVSTLTATQIGNIEGKKGNYYVVIGGVSVTKDGTSASGEFADITLFVDWLTARIQERIFALLVNTPKLPYTDQSVDLVRSEIQAQLQEGVDQQGLVAGTIVIDAPLVAEVAAVDRAARLLPDVQFSARLAGAIHTLDIRGNLTI